jgi:hypothetical protein
VLKTNGEEHLLYDGPDPAYQGLNPQDPSSLVYAINVPDHAPILLGAMYIMGGPQNGPQVGGGLTRWHSHLVTCVNGQQTIAGFGVQLRGGCDPATWQDKYTSQMLHVWVVPIQAASSPTTSARPRPTPPSRPCWRSTADRHVNSLSRAGFGEHASGMPDGLVRWPDGPVTAGRAAVITVSYNTRELTALLLWSLRRVLDWEPLEVVVVDNGSKDGSAELLAKGPRPSRAALRCRRWRRR